MVSFQSSESLSSNPSNPSLLSFYNLESAITYYSLPEFQSIDSSTSSAFPRIKGVASVVLDDEEILRQGGMDGQGMVSLCVVKRRSLLLLKCAREGCSQIKVSFGRSSQRIKRREGVEKAFLPLSIISKSRGLLPLEGLQMICCPSLLSGNAYPKRSYSFKKIRRHLTLQ